MANGSEDEESVDLCSEKFDPLKALYSKKVRLPNPSAPTLDNLAVYSAKQKQPVARPAPDRKKPTVQELAAKNRSRFLPHQLPVVTKNTFKVKNLLTRIRAQRGPLATLKTCLDKKLRVKVITRHESGIRGYCIGFVHAFDKQWNIAMTDVLEVWTRKRKNKILPTFEKLSIREDQLENLYGTKANVPRVRITKIEDGMEKCERHVPQMLMRGEHIVLIVLLEKSLHTP